MGTACVMEPWTSVAQKQRFRVLIEAHSSRSEAASDDLDGPALAAMFRAEGPGGGEVQPGAAAVQP